MKTLHEGDGLAVTGSCAAREDPENEGTVFDKEILQAAAEPDEDAKSTKDEVTDDKRDKDNVEAVEDNLKLLLSVPREYECTSGLLIKFKKHWPLPMDIDEEEDHNLVLLAEFD